MDVQLVFTLQNDFTFAFLDDERKGDVVFASNRGVDFRKLRTFFTHLSDDAKSLTDEENVAESETESGDLTPLPKKTLLEYFLESKTTMSSCRSQGRAAEKWKKRCRESEWPEDGYRAPAYYGTEPDWVTQNYEREKKRYRSNLASARESTSGKNTRGGRGGQDLRQEICHF